MKKLFLIVAAMFVAVSFSACSDDDDNGGEALAPKKLVKQIKSIDSYDDSHRYEEVFDITYDSENRIIRIETDSYYGNYRFTYGKNLLTIQSRSGIYACHLNSDGYITRIVSDMSNTSPANYNLEYKNGYLQSIEDVTRGELYEYQWSDGNLIEVRDYYDSLHDGCDQYKFSYSEKRNSINIDICYLDLFEFGRVFTFDELRDLGFCGFLGKRSAKLPCVYNGIGEGFEHGGFEDSYRYEFNADGTIAKVYYYYDSEVLELAY